MTETVLDPSKDECKNDELNTIKYALINKQVFENKTTFITSIVNLIHYDLATNAPAPKILDTSFGLAQPSIAWKPLARTWFKLNVNGSFMLHDEEAGGGGAIRLSDGSWFIGFYLSYKTLSPLGAELLGLKDGLKLAWDYNIRFLEAEVDAENILNLLGKTPLGHHELGAIIDDVLDIGKTVGGEACVHKKTGK